MRTVSVSVPDSIVPSFGDTDGQLERDSQFLLAVKLFEMGRITTSQAAGMCGMPSVDFLLAAERLNHPSGTSATA
jgi:hypothetical protein